MTASEKAPGKAALIAGFAAIYLVWGSTYLSIRMAVETLPLCLMSGARFLVAGGLIAGWIAFTRGFKTTRRRWSDSDRSRFPPGNNSCADGSESYPPFHRMKRLAWLLLAVFCTALAQVQPVELPAAKANSCPCCDVACPCGMPDCGLPPAQVSAAFLSVESAPVARPARRLEARRRPVEKFYACFVEPVAAPAGLAAPGLTAPAAGVPFFKAHCSFLL